MRLRNSLPSRWSLLVIVLATGAATTVRAGDFEAYRWEGDSVTIEAGNSQAHNIAVQRINPWPPHAGNSRINIDGSRALLGIERYKANQSITPRGLSTQSIISDQDSNK